ncbi:MAG: DNA adenine methylase [Promethearchaeia archaeon]
MPSPKKLRLQKNLYSFVDGYNEIDDFLKTQRKRNRKSKKIIGNPRPFLKWAGGKRQLIPQMDQYFPQEFDRYIEPFVGGGAIFFYLLPERAILNDINSDLINCYRIIKEEVIPLMQSLKGHKNDEDYYYALRKVDRTEKYAEWSAVQKASRIIYLNRCCYNGLYRVNSKGQFNVPFGRYKNPTFCDQENLIAIHKALQNTKLLNKSFEFVNEIAQKGDFIYFDPPYHPISESSSFTSYTKNDFEKKDQRKLAEIYKELNNRGCKLMLSNSFCQLILNLYSEFNIKKIKATRAINSDASKRGAINEVLVLNYSP